MSFELNIRERDGVRIVAPKGRLVLGPSLEKFRAALDEALELGYVKTALDFRGVDYIDSSALGCLVVAHTKFEKGNGVLTMFGLNQRSNELLVITKLSTIFRTAETETDAVNLCYPERGAAKFDILTFVEEQRKKKGKGE